MWHNVARAQRAAAQCMCHTEHIEASVVERPEGAILTYYLQRRLQEILRR